MASAVRACAVPLYSRGNPVVSAVRGGEAMSAALIRKARQLAADPVLRRWTVGHVLGRYPGEPTFTPHRPPYLNGFGPLAPELPETALRDLEASVPTTDIALSLPGETVRLRPEDADDFVRQSFADIEMALAVHRFAWLPLLGDGVDPAWVQALWSAWRTAHGEPRDDWSWHPYTAAERAINVLRFARRHGLPGPRGDTLAVLAAHGPAIAARLEYFGDHHTSNHLANDGRGLFQLGLALGLPACADLGGRILVEEAKRIFSPSGVLREGSSHYHLLLARNYADAWVAARTHGRSEEEALRATVSRALAVASRLALPAGLPLIGDISPDCPPDFLDGLLPGGDPTSGWTGLLDPDERDALSALIAEPKSVDASDLVADGWVRLNAPPWAGLWHAAPMGWSAMPGHGHQDVGSFEVHYGDEAVFVDPGRGAYGETGEAAVYRSAVVHNSLTVDGHDPYPTNRPYYDDRFRRQVGGPPPEMATADDGVVLAHHGFTRIGGVGAVERHWRFASNGFSIANRVDGNGDRTVARSLVTPLPVEREGNAVVVRGRAATYRVSGDAPMRLEHATRWRAYGDGEPATLILFEDRVSLPWFGTITVDVV